MADQQRTDYAAAIVEQDQDGLLIIARPASPQSTILFANAALARMLAQPLHRIEGQSLALLRSAGLDPLDLARLLRAVAEGVPSEVETVLLPDGEPVPMLIRGRPLGDGRGYLVRFTGRQSSADRVTSSPYDAFAAVSNEALYHLRLKGDLGLELDWTGGAFTRLTGYRRRDLEQIGGWMAVVEPGDRKIVQRRAQRLLGGEEEVAIEYRIRTRAGGRLWLRDRARPVWDENRELVVGLTCAAADITEQRGYEARLLARQQERKALIELSDGVVLAIDPEGRVRDVGGELPGELGRRLRAAVGRTLDEVLGPDGATSWHERIRDVLPGWPSVRFAFDFPTGLGEEHYQVTLAPGASRTVLAVLRPQSAALRLVPALAAGRNGDPRLAALIESLSEPSLLLAPDFRIQVMNRAAERLIAWSRDRALDRFFPNLLAVAEESLPVLDDLARALAGSAVEASETWIRLPGGQEGRVLWSFRPLQGEGGEVVAILAQGQPLAPVPAGPPIPATDQQRLELIIDHISDGVITLDGQGTIVSFSRSAETIFGFAQSEIVGSPIGRLLPPPDEAGPDAFQTIAELPRRAGRSHEAVARRKGGELVPLEISTSEVPVAGTTLYIVTARDVTVRKQVEQRIRNLAYQDPLTGLPNRLLFNDRLTQAIERARRNQQVFAVMILDIDRFKLINDSLGLASGDRVLRRVGDRLAGALRRSDTVARLGGDDFLILLPGVESAEGAAKVAQKLLDSVTPLLPVNGQELHVGASIGIAFYPHDGDEPETLVRNADTALYRAKERARGSYQFYTTDMNATAFERLILETQLRKAIERDELMVQYQPQVRIDTGEVVGVEALVRWRHPDLGTISPAEFIPLAEETGLIAGIGRFVLNTACAEVRRWRDLGNGGLRLAVNLSGRQFQEGDLVDLIAEVLRSTGFSPEDLELELTESSIMHDAEQTIGKLEALDRLGIKLSIDDFGTGYSSLSHLKRFPIKALKIDQSFIQDITTDPNDAAIAQAIIALAASLKLRVIAEGVETPQQLELLRRYDCHEMQGYLFSRPLPPEELLAFLRDRRKMLH